jgi:predicted nucleic acid-binding Zn ribbon protein
VSEEEQEISFPKFTRRRQDTSTAKYPDNCICSKWCVVLIQRERRERDKRNRIVLFGSSFLTHTSTHTRISQEFPRPLKVIGRYYLLSQQEEEVAKIATTASTTTNNNSKLTHKKKVQFHTHLQTTTRVS